MKIQLRKNKEESNIDSNIILQKNRHIKKNYMIDTDTKENSQSSSDEVSDNDDKNEVESVNEDNENIFSRNLDNDNNNSNNFRITLKNQINNLNYLNYEKIA